jgi:hypothetical protein
LHDDRINFEALIRNGYYTESNAYAALDAGITLPSIRTYNSEDFRVNGFSWRTNESRPNTVQMYPCVKTKMPGRKPWDGPDVPALARYADVAALELNVDFSWDTGFGQNQSANAVVDVWLLKNQHGGPAEVVAEVMLWFDKRGSIHPAGEMVEPIVPYVTAGPHGLSLWQRANEGDWPVFSFVCQDNSGGDGPVDLLPMIKHLVTRGSISGESDFWIGDVEFGCEVIEGEGFLQVNRFEVKLS